MKFEVKPIVFYIYTLIPRRPTLPQLKAAVSSAKKGLTSRFEMALGGTPSL